MALVFSVVLYPHQKYAELAPEEIAYLTSIGFQLPMDVASEPRSEKPASGVLAPQALALLEVNVPFKRIRFMLSRERDGGGALLR